MNNRETSPRQTTHANDVADFGIPPFGAILLMLAFTLAACGLSLYSTRIAEVFLALFATGSILSVLLVKTRGVYLTTALIPVFFGFAVPTTAGVIGTRMAAQGDTGVSKTDVLTALYPLAQHFPWLMGIVGVATVIAIAKYVLASRRYKQIAFKHRRDYVQQRFDDRSNVATTRRVRRSQRAPRPGDDTAVTVEQLAKERRDRVARLSKLNNYRRPGTASASTINPSMSPTASAPGGSQPVTPPRPPAAPQPFRPTIPPATTARDNTIVPPRGGQSSPTYLSGQASYPRVDRTIGNVPPRTSGLRRTSEPGARAHYENEGRHSAEGYRTVDHTRSRHAAPAPRYTQDPNYPGDVRGGISDSQRPRRYPVRPTLRPDEPMPPRHGAHERPEPPQPPREEPPRRHSWIDENLYED